jgi:hypothetical protein
VLPVLHRVHSVTRVKHSFIDYKIDLSLSIGMEVVGCMLLVMLCYFCIHMVEFSYC